MHDSGPLASAARTQIAHRCGVCVNRPQAPAAAHAAAATRNRRGRPIRSTSRRNGVPWRPPIRRTATPPAGAVRGVPASGHVLDYAAAARMPAAAGDPTRHPVRERRLERNPDSRTARRGRSGPRAHHRRLDPRRDRCRQRAAGPGQPAAGRARAGAREGFGTGRARARQGLEPECGRVVHARVRPFQRRGRAADVRGRGAAAHSRRRDGRQADPRQARRGRLEEACRRQRIAVRQRLDLGPDADRPPGRPGRGDAQQLHRRAQAPDRPRRRAGRAPGGAPGDAHHGSSVRDGPDHRGGAGPRRAQGQPGLSLFIRHARRGGADPGRRGPLPAGLSRRDRCARPARTVARRARRAVDLGQAVGDPPALRRRQPRPRARRADAARAGTGAAGQVAGDRHDRRRRGGRPARAVAGRDRRGVRRSFAGRLERIRTGGAGLSEARTAGHRLAGRDRAQGRTALVRAPGQGRVLGLGGQARAGAGPGRLSGLHAQAEHRRVVSGLCAPDVRGGRRPDLSAVRDAQRAHDRRDPSRRARPSVRAPASARHGCRSLRRGHRTGQPRCAVPRLRAGRQPRGPAAVSGPAPARERRQYQLRQPRRRRGRLDPRPGRRSLRAGTPSRQQAPPAHPPADRSVRRTTEEFHGRQFRQRSRTACAGRQRQRRAPPLDRRPAGAGRRDRRAGQAGHRSVRPPSRDRRVPPGRRRDDREGADQRRRRAAGLGCAAGRQPRQDPRACRRPARVAPRRVHRDGGARGRQDAAGRRLRGARGGRLPALLRGDGAQAVRPARAAAGPDRRVEPAVPARPRRVRLHQSLELPAGDLHGPGRRRAGRRQRRAGQAGRADHADRLRGHAPAARGRRARGRAAVRAGQGFGDRQAAADATGSGRRMLHRVDRDGLDDQPHAGRTRRLDRRADRRDRRPERADRRLLGAARAAGQGRRRLGLRFGRPALLGRAHPVRAGRHRRQGRDDAGRRDAGAQRRRSGPAVDRRRSGHRRCLARDAGRARRAYGS